MFAATKARGIALKKVWADQTYRGVLGPWMATNGMGELEIVERLVGQCSRSAGPSSGPTPG